MWVRIRPIGPLGGSSPWRVAHPGSRFGPLSPVLGTSLPHTEPRLASTFHDGQGLPLSAPVPELHHSRTSRLLHSFQRHPRMARVPRNRVVSAHRPSPRITQALSTVAGVRPRCFCSRRHLARPRAPAVPAGTLELTASSGSGASNEPPSVRRPDHTFFSTRGTTKQQTAPGAQARMRPMPPTGSGTRYVSRRAPPSLSLARGPAPCLGASFSARFPGTGEEIRQKPRALRCTFRTWVPGHLAHPAAAAHPVQ